MEDAIRITEQEAHVSRNGKQIVIPRFFREIIEQVAFEARKSEFVDQKSGVSARLTIAAMENLVSNAERRAILVGEPAVIPRMCDLPHVLPGLTGKIELVFEGEQEGSVKVGKALVGKAVRETFRRYFPDPLRKRGRKTDDSPGAAHVVDEAGYEKIVQWFEAGNTIEVADDMPVASYRKELEKVKGLREIVQRHMPGADKETELPVLMEFVLEGLHQNSKIAKDEVDHVTSYKDMVGSIFPVHGGMREEDQDIA
jgi:magnesium chelatase subunit I